MRRLAVVIACALVISAVPKDTAGAGTVFRAHNWNVAMGNPDYRNYDGVINSAVNFVRQFPAWQVTFEEMCLGQAEQIQDQLYNNWGQNFNLTFGVATAGTNACAGGKGPWGNAILALGGHISARAQYLNPQYPNDPKVIVCARTQNFGFITENCAAHVSARGNPQDYTSWTIPQIDDARNIKFIWRAIDGAYSLTGIDMNLPFAYGCGMPCMPNPQFTNWHADDQDAHIPNWYETAHNPPRMLDYIWADRRLFHQWGSYPCTFSGVSDHSICPGVFSTP